MNSCVYFISCVSFLAVFTIFGFRSIGRVRFGKHSASGELLGPIDFETSDVGARELVRLKRGSTGFNVPFSLTRVSCFYCHSLTKRLPFDEDEFDYIRVKFISK